MSYYDIGHILNEIYNPESGSIDLFTSYGNVLNAIYDPERRAIAVLRKFNNVATNKLTYLPTHSKDLMMWLSGAIQTSTQSSNLEIGILKNGMSSSIYGYQIVTLDSNNRSFT